MPFTSESAKEAGTKSKRGPSVAAIVLAEWREKNKDKALGIIDMYLDQAAQGDIDSAKIILPYYFGKPKETLEIQSGSEDNEFIIRVVNSKSDIQTK